MGDGSGGPYMALSARRRAERVLADQWDRFSRSASPEQITDALEAERRSLGLVQSRVHRLEDLLAQRILQVARGEWPPDPDGAREQPRYVCDEHGWSSNFTPCTKPHT